MSFTLVEPISKNRDDVCWFTTRTIKQVLKDLNTKMLKN